jgi:hypothetical protein
MSWKSCTQESVALNLFTRVSTVGSLMASAAPTEPPPTQKILYDRKSAAYALSISVRSLDYLIANKRLNTLKMGSKVMLSHGELIKFSRQNHASLSESNG